MILSNPFNQQEFTDFVTDFLPNFKLDVRKIEPGNSGFREVLRLGTSSEVRTEVLVVRSSKNINSRISLTNNSFKILKTYSIYRALVVYVNDDETIWRLSLLTATPKLSSDGKTVLNLSNPRRHSYVLGTEVGVATARRYLSSGPIKDFADLEFRFSVEVVNKDFYKEITEHFYKLIGRYGGKNEVLLKPELKLPNKQASIEDLQNYSVRLLGRIIFLWFLRQKRSSNGTPLLPNILLDIDGLEGKDILHQKIEPLFFEVLNKQIQSRDEKFRVNDFGRVPYLNGGLFHPSEGNAGDYYNLLSKTSEVQIPDSWFAGFIETLNTYNFTIDENLEHDVELSIDPEMLGRVFENLLAEINPETGQQARKSTGSFYTPRSIVNLMVDQSIEEYLRSFTGIDSNKIKALVTTTKLDDLEHPLTSIEKSKVVEAISNLKVLDPACGSGAFPMGVLQKLLWVITQVDPKGEDYLDTQDMEGAEHWLSENRLDYLRKRKIIRDVIFGTDIQPVAIEIAKLRCFLTLIVDQEIDDTAQNRGVVPLPNLDFKFICADSLIPLDENKQLTFGDDPQLESKLEKLRNKYFSTNKEDVKEKLKLEYEKYIQQDLKLFSESKRALQLKTFHPFKNNSRANFFDPNTMFGFSKFDLVIGNPPYISALAAKKILPAELRDEYKKSYEAARGAYDMYLLFMELGMNILKSSGSLIFITPTKFLSAKYAESFRKLTDKNLVKIIDFENSRIFESAGVSTLVSLFSKQNRNDEVVCEIFSGNADNDVQIKKFPRNSLSEFPEQTWGHLKWGDFLFLRNVYARSSKLEDICTVVASSTAAEADDWSKQISANKSETSFKMINTGTIRPYFNLWSLSGYSNKKTKILTPYLDSTGIDSRRIEMFKSPKLIVAKLSKRLKASLDEKGDFASSNTVFIYEPKSPYTIYTLAGIVNSSVMSYIYRSTFSGLNLLGSFQFQAPQMRILPLPTDPDPKLIKQLDALVKNIIKNVDREITASVLRDIDKLVSEIYGLAQNELDFLEVENMENSLDSGKDFNNEELTLQDSE